MIQECKSMFNFGGQNSNIDILTQSLPCYKDSKIYGLQDNKLFGYISQYIQVIEYL